VAGVGGILLLDFDELTRLVINLLPEPQGGSGGVHELEVSGTPAVATGDL